MSTRSKVNHEGSRAFKKQAKPAAAEASVFSDRRTDEVQHEGVPETDDAEASTEFRAYFSEKINVWLINFSCFVACPWSLVFNTSLPLWLLGEFEQKQQWTLSMYARLLLMVVVSFSMNVFIVTSGLNLWTMFETRNTDANMYALMYQDVEAKYIECKNGYQTTIGTLAAAVVSKIEHLQINATAVEWVQQKAFYLADPLHNIPVHAITAITGQEAELMYRYKTEFERGCTSAFNGWKGMPQSLGVYLDPNYSPPLLQAMFYPPILATLPVLFYSAAFMLVLYGGLRVGMFIGDTWRRYYGRRVPGEVYSHATWTVFFGISMVVIILHEIVSGVTVNPVTDALFFCYMQIVAVVCMGIAVFIVRLGWAKANGSPHVSVEMAETSFVYGLVIYAILRASGFLPVHVIVSSAKSAWSWAVDLVTSMQKAKQVKDATAEFAALLQAAKEAKGADGV